VKHLAMIAIALVGTCGALLVFLAMVVVIFRGTQTPGAKRAGRPAVKGRGTAWMMLLAIVLVELGFTLIFPPLSPIYLGVIVFLACIGRLASEVDDNGKHFPG
jgi:hypothetical protein